MMLQVNGYPVIYMVGNGVFAALPCLLTRWLHHQVGQDQWQDLPPGRRWLLGGVFVLWCGLLPHTVYGMTLIHHLCHHPPAGQDGPTFQQVWHPLFFFAYGLGGFTAFYYALATTRRIVSQLFTLKLYPIFPLGMIPLAMFGATLGLVERVDSWDVVVRPHHVFMASWHIVGAPDAWVGYGLNVLLMLGIFYSADACVKSAARRQVDPTVSNTRTQTEKESEPSTRSLRPCNN